jgi:DNA-binding transcriptional MerR regulator
MQPQTNNANGGKRLKMKDLERATGVGRETIRFYIRNGLLPEPERPGRNVAWYDESFVRRVNLIKELQQKRFLPLNVIRAIVGVEAAPSRDEVQTLLELDGKLFPAVDGADPSPERLVDVVKRTGLTMKDARDAIGVGLVETTRRGRGEEWLDDVNVRILEILAKLRAAGFTPERGFVAEEYRLYVDFVRWLAREELRIFTSGTTGKAGGEELVEMAEAGITYVNQMLGLLRRATLLRYISEANQNTEGISDSKFRNPTETRT